MEYPEKQPKKRSPVGLILLVLLLLILGLLGYGIYSITKAPLHLEDPAKMAASVPMPAAKRFRVSAAEKTVQVKLDSGDLWYLISDALGENFLEEANAELSSYDLSLGGCGLQLQKEGLTLHLELFYKEHRLAVRIPCAMEAAGQSLTVTLTGVKVGVIPLPVEKLLAEEKIDLELVLPVLDDMTGIGFEEGAILLTGTVGQDLRALIPQGKSLYSHALFDPALRPLADSLETEAGFASLLGQWEQDPGSLEDTYRQLFLLTEPRLLEEYLTSHSALTQRFFPELSFTVIKAKQEEQSRQLGVKITALEQFFTAVVSEYNDKRFLLKDGTFYLYGSPFRAGDFGGGEYDSLFESLDPESFCPVLVNVEDGFIRKTSSFYRLAKEGLEFTREVDYNRTYILGFVLRSTAGEPYLMYESEIQGSNSYSRIVKLVPLTEEDVKELQQEGKFGVWTGEGS